MQRDKRILVIGSGGIGSLYGALLHRVGWQVELVARSDHAVIREQGLHIDSVLGDLSFRPEKVYASVADAGTFPWIMIAVKMLPTTDFAELVRPAVTKDTVLFLIANGLEVEKPLAAAYPDNPLVSCVAFVGTSREAPGQIRHISFGRLVMGNYPVGVSEEATLLADDFKRAGNQSFTSDNITRERWKKSIWNASFNPLSVLANGADTGRLLGTPAAEQLVRAIMAEVIDTACAEGFALEGDLVERNLANTRAMPPYLTSMALDYLHQHPLELEAIVGRVVSAADRHGLAIPHLRTVYTLLAIRSGEKHTC